MTRAYLYLHTTNSDLTEGRGWPVPVAFYDDLAEALAAWHKSGVQGTEGGASVHLVAVGRDARFEGNGYPNLLRQSTEVVGEHLTVLGWRRGVIPATQQKPWSADKQHRFAQLRERFPDEPLPEPGPTLASTMPAPLHGALDEVFLLTVVQARMSGAVLEPVSVHTTAPLAVRAAERARAAVAYEAPRDQPTSDEHLLRVVRVRVGERIGRLAPGSDRIVWAEARTDVDGRRAAELAEYRALLADLARGA